MSATKRRASNTARTPNGIRDSHSGGRSRRLPSPPSPLGSRGLEGDDKRDPVKGRESLGLVEVGAVRLEEAPGGIEVPLEYPAGPPG